MSKTVVNKVTKVVWDNGFKPDGVNIPSVTSADQGKVLAVDSNGKWVAASPAAPQSELPVYTAADEGKILKVDDQGDLEWAEDDNTQYTAGDNVSIVNGEISAVDTTYTAGDNVAISADNEISSVNTIVFNAKYFRATDTFQYDADAIAPFLAEIAKNDKRPIVRVQDGNYDIYDIYTLEHYEVYNKIATFTKTHPIIVSANQREIVSANIGLAVNNGVGTLRYTVEGVVDLPEGATAGQVPISDGHSGWVAGDIPSELPSVTSADEGKVLKVDSNGDWAVGTDEDTKYTAGTNVQINGSVISATDTTYTAGTNVQINNGVISATDTTYTAGNGITITGTTIAADDQLPSVTSSDEGKILTVDSNGDWVKGDNDIDAVKAAIAEEFGIPAATVYKVPADYTGIGLDKGFIRFYTDKGELNRDFIYLPYSATYNAYMAIIDSYTQWGTLRNEKAIIIFIPNETPGYSLSIGVASYRVADGQISTGSPVTCSMSYSGSQGSGAYGIATTDLTPMGPTMEEVSYDLSSCEYASDTAAIDEFANNPIPSGGYSEGDQVWKDGKLQTYTNGNWVDSDPIVEQIANAGGAGETLTLIDSKTVTNAKTETWSGSANLARFTDLDFGTYSKILVTITPDETSNTNTQFLLRSNYYTAVYLEARKLGSNYVFNPVYMGKYSDMASNPSYKVMCCFDAFVSGSNLIVQGRSDYIQTSTQPYLFRYNNAVVSIYGIS